MEPGDPVKVAVASGNPVKVEATEEAFRRYFDAIEVVGLPVGSGVSEQPFGEETLRGARNRARALRQRPEAAAAAYCVGIEGGIESLGERWFAFGCMCISDGAGREGFGSSARFELPPEVVRAVRAGAELGDVMDRLTDQRGSKRRGGAIGYFTRGVMDRRELYVGGLVVALIPLLHPAHYFPATVDA